MKAAVRIAVFVAICVVTLFGAQAARAITFTFSDVDYISGQSWGTLEITAFDANTLQLTYTAEPDTVIPDGSRVTGFGFTFIPETTTPTAVVNPADGAYSWDLDELDWVYLDNTYPNPANGDEFTPPIDKFDFFFNIANDPNSEGIYDGEADIFFLDFSGVPDLTAMDLGFFVALTGIRLQSLPEDINTGSLFLVGKPDTPSVPEPGTLLLLGSGLVGLGVWRRRRKVA